MIQEENDMIVSNSERLGSIGVDRSPLHMSQQGNELSENPLDIPGALAEQPQETILDVGRQVIRELDISYQHGRENGQRLQELFQKAARQEITETDLQHLTTELTRLRDALPQQFLDAQTALQAYKNTKGRDLLAALQTISEHPEEHPDTQAVNEAAAIERAYRQITEYLETSMTEDELNRTLSLVNTAITKLETVIPSASEGGVAISDTSDLRINKQKRSWLGQRAIKLAAALALTFLAGTAQEAQAQDSRYPTPDDGRDQAQTMPDKSLASIVEWQAKLEKILEIISSWNWEAVEEQLRQGASSAQEVPVTEETEPLPTLTCTTIEGGGSNLRRLPLTGTETITTAAAGSELICVNDPAIAETLANVTINAAGEMILSGSGRNWPLQQEPDGRFFVQDGNWKWYLVLVPESATANDAVGLIREDRLTNEINSTATPAAAPTPAETTSGRAGTDVPATSTPDTTTGATAVPPILPNSVNPTETGTETDSPAITDSVTPTPEHPNTIVEWELRGEVVENVRIDTDYEDIFRFTVAEDLVGSPALSRNFPIEAESVHWDVSEENTLAFTNWGIALIFDAAINAHGMDELATALQLGPNPSRTQIEAAVTQNRGNLPVFELNGRTYNLNLAITHVFTSVTTANGMITHPTDFGVTVTRFQAEVRPRRTIASMRAFTTDASGALTLVMFSDLGFGDSERTEDRLARLTASNGSLPALVWVDLYQELLGRELSDPYSLHDEAYHRLGFSEGWVLGQTVAPIDLTPTPNTP